MVVVKRMLPLVVFAILVVFLWKGLGKNPSVVPSALVGKPVPSFDYPTLMNPSQDVTNKLFLGHVSLLNVWATWCITCKAEHGQLMEIARSGVVNIYGLNYKDDRAKAVKWLKTEGDPFKKVIYDPKGNLAINLGVYGTPETFVIDKKGIIRDKVIGPISPQVWQDRLLPEIKKLES